MTRLRLILILPLLSLGCRFDAYLGEQQAKYRAAYPVRLLLKNGSSHAIRLRAMEISPEGKQPHTFDFLHAMLLPPGATDAHLGIDESMYEAIRLGRFLLTVDCEGRSPRQVSGETLERCAVHDSHQWAVTVTGMSCELLPDAGVLKRGGTRSGRATACLRSCEHDCAHWQRRSGPPH